MDNLIIIANKKFCPYCGQEIYPNEHGQFICDCQDANHARAIEREAMLLEWNATILRKSKPEPRFCAQTVCSPIPNTNQKPQHHECKSSNAVWENPHEKYPEE